MRAYWFWPYLRPEHLPLVDATANQVGSLAVQTVAGRIPSDACTRASAGVIEPVLDDVDAGLARSLRWASSRASGYARRARQRNERATQGFDIAHVVFLNYLVDWYSIRGLRRRVPVVSTVHDVVPHETRLPRRLERALLARTYAEAGTLIVHHPSIGDRLVADFDVSAERIHVVPHWVLPYPWQDKRRPESVPTVLLFGALRANKGVTLLLETMEQLRGVDLRLVIAGRGAPELERAVLDAAAHDDRISAEIGYVSEERKHALYRASDLVVLPYVDFTSQSGVLHDAYAHHRPVVVTDVGALGETVRSDGTGWVCPPSAGDLAARIDRALGEPDAWLRAAEACGAIAAQRSVEATAARFAAVYERAIG